MVLQIEQLSDYYTEVSLVMHRVNGVLLEEPERATKREGRMVDAAHLI